jgi:hypothetical protein
MAKPFKLKASVFFTARVESGAGRITNIIETARGIWYEVTRASDKRKFKVRAAQLEAAS